MEAVFRQRIGEFRKMPSLPAKLIDGLEDAFGTSILAAQVLEQQESAQATKVLFGEADGQRVETVHLRYRAGWHSYCISSQVGCGFKCSFCATGTIGLLRNMTTDEITDQILHFHLAGHPIDSISFMGMGEALANRATFDALSVFTDPELFGLGARRISVSTIGLPKGIDRLTSEFPQVGLTLSVHSPFDEQRSELMPINKTHPLGEVLQHVDRYVADTHRKVYFAYVLLDDVNDSPEHAGALAALVRVRPHHVGMYHVNVIRYNQAHNVSDDFARASKKKAQDFVETLKAGGAHVTVRQSFGVEIDAACGQLYSKYSARRPRPRMSDAKETPLVSLSNAGRPESLHTDTLSH